MVPVDLLPQALQKPVLELNFAKGIGECRLEGFRRDMRRLNTEDVIFDESFIELVELIKIDLVQFVHHFDARCHCLHLQAVLLIRRVQQLPQLILLERRLGACNQAAQVGGSVLERCSRLNHLQEGSALRSSVDVASLRSSSTHFLRDLVLGPVQGPEAFLGERPRAGRLRVINPL